MGLKLSEIKKSLKRFFERKKKNPILYGNDSVLDPDLKPFRIGQKQTIVELSDSELKVRGTIDADAISVNGASVQTGTDAGATELNELSDVTYSSGDLTISSLDKIITTGDLALVVDTVGDNWTFENTALVGYDSGTDTVVAEIGAAIATTTPNYLLTLYDRANASSMTGSGPAIKFRKHYYAFGGGSEEDAGTISFLTEGNWTNTASTRDSKFQMQNVLNGALQTCMEISSDLTATLYSKIQLLDTTDNADMFTIDVGASGATTIATVDDGAAVGHLTLDADGDIILDPQSGITKFYRGGDTDDLCTLTVGGDGTTTIATADSDGTVGHLTLDADGDITLNSTSGNFIAEKAGTEFSATNSAYAGMVLGYSVFRNATSAPGNDQITIGTTMTVLETNQGNKVNVSFVAPPSGKVEIIFSAMMTASSRQVFFSLSDNASYNEVSAIHSYDSISVKPDETDYVSLYLPFVIQGLTAGTSYQYWIAGDSSSASSYIYHGVDRAGLLNTQPITVKAIALPATIVSEE